jgi:hypothetical protein
MHTLNYAQARQFRPRRYLERALLFALAATSIWSLLAEFYAVSSMRAFALFIFVPATAALLIWAARDRAGGSGYAWRVVWVGAVAGFIAACAYDVFRLPFVFAREMHIDPVVPHLPLFKVFPAFGKLILGEPLVAHISGHPTPNSLADHLIGWAYHFSNGMTFGIMYLALVGDAGRRSWWWAVVLAVVLELGMLLTPYPNVFGIKVTKTFVAVTLSAHLVFGVALGLCARRLWRAGAVRSARRAARPAKAGQPAG